LDLRLLHLLGLCKRQTAVGHDPDQHHDVGLVLVNEPQGLTSVSRLDAGVGERRAEESPDLIVVVDHEDA
jgi:hypothetical protein